MSGSYLKKYYLDNDKLAQRARLEFARAMRTNRMTAFVGSMATQAFGYGSWTQLRMLVAYLARRVIDSLDADAGQPGHVSDQAKQTARGNIAFLDSQATNGKLDAVVAMSLIEEVLDRPEIRHGKVNVETFKVDGDKFKDLLEGSTWPLDQVSSPLGYMKMLLAHRFRSPDSRWWIGRNAVMDSSENFDSDYNVPWLLWSKLGIRRYVTTNYDFEIERVTMLGGQTGFSRGDAHLASAFSKLAEKRARPDSSLFSWDLGSGRIRRVFDDGWAIESDLLNRERIDRMIEFAVGTDDYDSHILHLHGRADDWRSMIVTLRDYDRLYRHNDLNRAPFELAKRMMMAGNPLLFVGLGMTEQTLNRELEEFISNNPYQRVAPAFVLWSVVPGAMGAEAKRAKRLELLRRLGVMTIFDDELGMVHKGPEHFRFAGKAETGIGNSAFGNWLKASTSPKSPDFLDKPAFDVVDRYHYRPMLKALATGLERLADRTDNCPSRRENVAEAPWRSKGMEKKFPASGPSPKAVVLWDDNIDNGTPAGTPLGAAGYFANNLSDAEAAINAHPMTCVIGGQGCGKGQAARAVMERVNANPKAFGLSSEDQCMVIHGNFSFDTDSLLDAVAQFLELRLGGPNKWRDANTGQPHCSRSAYFKSLHLDQPANRTDALIIINGMERFCGINGRMLSAELDELLRLSFKVAAQNAGVGNPLPRIRWLLFGTERVRHYASDIGAGIMEFDTLFPTKTPRTDLPVPNWYLDSIRQKAGLAASDFPAPLKQAIADYRANSSGRVSGDSIEMRKAFLSHLLSDDTMRTVLGKTDDNNVRIARRLLRALAFVGAPTELSVLMRMPQLAPWRDTPGCVQDVLDSLCNSKIILTLRGFAAYEPAIDPTQNVRYALHRAMLTELRYRFGIPLNEAKLSTAFNMSLYVAQPLDGDIPDSDIHDELGDTIDTLIGGYKTRAQRDEADAEAELKSLAKNAGLRVGVLDAASAACLACAGSSGANGPAQRLAIYHLCRPEHVQSLRAALSLVRSYYSTTGLLTLNSGDRLVRDDRDGILLEHAERLDDLIDGYGKITLARQELRKQLGEQRFVKMFGDAEPFYADELVWLHNERGVVRLAMGDLYEAEFSFIRAVDINRQWVERDDRAHNWRRIRLNQLTVDMERGRIGTAERKIDELIAITKQHPISSDEDKLALAITRGYAGWTKHLRGQFADARKAYDSALKSFAKLDEARAAAYFHRLRVDVLDRQTSSVERRPDIVEAIQMAQASRQMDIVHRLNIKLADELVFGHNMTKADHERGQRLLEDALTYALQTDVHRVRCEAAMTIARTRHATGDFEGALRFAMDALMIACRYGMELRKISLRALIAKIMAARGHPVTAEHLARTCIKMATRQRFENAIDSAEKVLLSLPKMSQAITGTDLSGQRRY